MKLIKSLNQIATVVIWDGKKKIVVPGYIVIFIIWGIIAMALEW